MSPRRRLRALALAGARAATRRPPQSAFDSSNISAAGSELRDRRRGRPAPSARPPRPDISKAAPSSTISMKTKSGTSREDLVAKRWKRSPSAIDSMMIACGRPSLAEVRRLLHRARRSRPAGSCCAARRGSRTRSSRRDGDDQHVAAGERLRVGSMGAAVVDLGRADRPAISSPTVRGNSSISVVLPPTSLRSTTEAHRPCRLLDAGARSASRGAAAPRRPLSSAWSAGRCANRQVRRACTGQVLKSIANSMIECALASAQSSVVVEQAEEQRRVDDDARPASASCFERDAARLRFRARAARARSSAPRPAAAARATGARRPDAKRVSCWPIMPAWRACSTSSRSARRPGAVDACRCVQRLDALERRGQWRGDLAAEMAEQLAPPLARRVGLARSMMAGPGALGLGVDVRDVHALVCRMALQAASPHGAPIVRRGAASVDPRGRWRRQGADRASVKIASIAPLRWRRRGAAPRSPRRRAPARPAPLRCRSPSSGGARRYCTGVADSLIGLATSRRSSASGCGMARPMRAPRTCGSAKTSARLLIGAAGNLGRLECGEPVVLGAGLHQPRQQRHERGAMPHPVGIAREAGVERERRLAGDLAEPGELAVVADGEDQMPVAPTSNTW